MNGKCWHCGSEAHDTGDHVRAPGGASGPGPQHALNVELRSLLERAAHAPLPYALLHIAMWLEAGNDPKAAAEELRLLADCAAESQTEMRDLRNAALGVANALHVGTGALIRGTMMESDLRQALRLKTGELWNFTTEAAEPSGFSGSQGERT